jgi:hypothetical protein
MLQANGMPCTRLMTLLQVISRTVKWATLRLPL